MTRLTALFILLPLLATLADAGPINRSSRTTFGRRSPHKSCHRKSADGGKKPEWADYAAAPPADAEQGATNSGDAAWKGWSGKHQAGSDAEQSGEGEDGKGGMTSDGEYAEESGDEDKVTKTTYLTVPGPSPTPTEAQTEDAIPEPSPTTAPAPTADPSPSPAPAPAPAPAPVPDNNGYDADQPCRQGTGEHKDECLRDIPVPHPHLKPMPQWPKTNDQQSWIEAHNMARAMFGVGQVGWSEGAYAQAKANVEGHAANGCKMEHTKDGKFGENLFWTSWGSGDNGPDVGMGMWMDEAKNFNWSDPNHQTADLGAWGHFTPIVWKDMTEIGCATAGCPSGATIGACCYNGGVNMGGQYEKMVPEPL